VRLCSLSIRVGGRIAVIRGGARHFRCDSLPLTQEEIARSEKPVYAGPAGVVVVVVAPQDRGEPVSKRGVPEGCKFSLLQARLGVWVTARYS
jgi:hypothetical protein